jgi:flagellin-like hook-associated protein FlgL
VREKVDVGFLVDVSASMSASIATLKTQVGAFEDQLTRQGLDVAFGLARVGADNVDRVDRSADIGVGFDGALAALGIAGFFPMDPYSAITEVLGETSVSGAIEPDAFTWRPGAARVLVYLTDTGRETAAQSLTEEEVGDAAADRTVTVHIVGTPGSGDDDDGVPGSDLDGIAARSGGTYFSRGTSSGSGIEAALAAIARTVEGSAGPTQIAFHIDVGSAEGEDRLVLDALPFDARPSALDVADVSIATEEGARDALAKIDGAIEGVSSLRADAGALMNRLASAARTLEAREVADRASRSRLVDADVAVEAAALARQQLLARAMVGLLPKVQAIQRDAVLRLLSG